MTDRPLVSTDETDSYYEKLNKDALAGGYNLNPDTEFTRDLVEGLIVNQKRYGYPACPCRAAAGIQTEDLDIICPCDYRDPDLDEHQTCFCGLYVTKWAIDNNHKITSIPERRPPKTDRKAAPASVANLKTPSIPVWRCKVCGYLCGRDNPPEICPICRAKKDRFELFIE